VTLTALALAGAVKDEARRLGFDAAAIGPATAAAHGEAFERWLDDGRAGTMDYLERTRRERRDPGLLLAGARAVVTVAMSYRPAAAAAAGGAAGMRVARYAGRRDYHDVMRPRLRALADFIGRAAGPGVESRAAVDTSAVLERDAAARAGLGWIGKNTNLLTPSLGSWFFLGAVLTTAGPAFDTEVPDRCGTCTACLDACPTAAFTAPYVLDARRCIAYLTIEHRGDIDEALRGAMGDWGFGCDICQDVCPWNRKAARASEPAFAGGEALSPRELLDLDEAGFRARFRGTAFWRARRSGLLRNAAIVLGNRADRRAEPALRRALDDPDPVIRRAASWALSRLDAGGAEECRNDASA
jgi:epoxyqueuosine reductase